MNRNKNKNLVTGMLALVVSVIAIGLVYAGFTGTLNINGTGEVRASKWDIHFENLDNGVVSGTAVEVTQPQITNGRTTIGDYEVELYSPGDKIYYIFDVVNDGNFDASLSSLTKGTPQCTNDDDVCDYIIYELKYTSTGSNYTAGDTVSVNDTLNAGERRTLILSIELDRNIPANKLAQNDVIVSNLGITLLYSQSTNYTDNLAEQIDNNNKSMFKYTTSNNKVTINGYRNMSPIFEVEDQTACVNGLTQMAINTYGLEQSEASYAASELCQGNEVEGLTLEQAIYDGTLSSDYYSSLGLNVTGTLYCDVINKTACENGVKQMLMSNYGMEESSAEEDAEDLCDGKRVGGQTLASAVASGAIPEEYYETLGLSVSRTTSFTPITNNLVIPDTIDGKPVVAIGNNAFQKSGITSVTLPGHLRTIGVDAFEHNQLTSLIIPDGVTSIGVDAFAENQLTSVTIPNSVTSIGSDTFRSNQLTSVTIPNSVTSIEDSAFRNNQLTSVTIPNSVTTIGDYAFAYNQLTSVTIPNSVTSIGGYAFSNNQLTSVTIPNSVTSIGGYAFADNQLTSVTIPNSVTSIGSLAFSNNPITTVSIDMTNIPNYMFWGGLGGSIIDSNTKLTSLTLGEHVQTIGVVAFYNNQLTSITIPNSVTSIGSSAFRNNQLTSVTIKTKTSSSQFSGYGNSIWGWKSDVTCVKDNTSNVTNGCITWGAQ